MGLTPLHAEHEYWQEQLSAHLDGRLDGREEAILDAHLATCEACRGELDQLRATVGLLRRAPVMVAPRSFRIREADLVRAADLAGEVGWSWGGWLRGLVLGQGLQLATGAAAVLLIGLVTYDVGAGVLSQPALTSERATSLAAPAAAPAAAPSLPQTFRGKAADSGVGGSAAGQSADQAPLAPSHESAPSSSWAPSIPAPQDLAQDGRESAVGAASGLDDQPGVSQEALAAQEPDRREAARRGSGEGVPPLRIAEGVLAGLVLAGVTAVVVRRRRAERL